MQGDIGSSDFLRFVEAATQPLASAHAFQALVRGVRALLPHGMCIAAIGRVSFEQLEIVRIIGIDYPPAYIEQMPQALNIRERPVLSHWMRLRSPVIIDTQRDRSLMSAREMHEADTFGMGRLAIHGQIDLASRMGSYFSFAQVDAGADEGELRRTLKMITPHLHAALTSIGIDPVASGDVGLSPTERGKARISQVAGCCESAATWQVAKRVEEPMDDR